MKLSSPKRGYPFHFSGRAFTLIEMLIVIGIIAVLAALLLPVFGAVKRNAKINMARLDMKGLEAAIHQYNTEYSRLPGVQPAGSLTNDVTYGYPLPSPPANAYTSNSDIVAILMNANFGQNANFAQNPHKVQCFTPQRHSSDTLSPGLSSVDGQLRDPWGKPYVISLDLNGDGYCLDALYSLMTVSQQSTFHGYNGLMDFARNDIYLIQGPVMIWSLGPDGQASSTVKANVAPNQDNVLSWQQ